MAESDAEAFTEVEHEVAGILSELADLVRARSPRRRRERERKRREEGIPSWGCRRRRSLIPAAAEKPDSTPPAHVSVVEVAVASPDTPLVFLPDESSGGDDGDDAPPTPTPALAAEADRRAAPPSHAEWVQEQRAVVASLSEENSHLYKQIEEYKIRLQSSRSTNDDLKLMMHGKLKRQREEEEKQLKRKLPATAIDRPAPEFVLDLNEPARAPEEEDNESAAAAAVAEWYQQQAAIVYKAAMTAEARQRRREIRRAKTAPSRIRRGGS
uniref:Uncharacterized protein n=1 Tax=Leersia perrieri TaxID=77586 RepID=A0A0D9VBH4_9ORYZ